MHHLSICIDFVHYFTYCVILTKPYKHSFPLIPQRLLVLQRGELDSTKTVGCHAWLYHDWAGKNRFFLSKREPFFFGYSYPPRCFFWGGKVGGGISPCLECFFGGVFFVCAVLFFKGWCGVSDFQCFWKRVEDN